MTVVGGLVLLGWVPAVAFLFFHGRAYLRAERKNWAGTAVLVMAAVVFIVMTLALVRTTFEISLPEWVRGGAFLLILIALWWKLITILRYEYGKRAPLVESTGARELEREDSR
jgi:protein-S-isoprenylcysteine O-methyltransferase Ste14